MLQGQMVWFRWNAEGTVQYEYFTPWLVCVKAGEQEQMQACFFHLSHIYCRLGKKNSRHSTTAMSEMLYPTIGICSLGLGWISHYFSLLGQSSLHAASWYMGHAWVPWQQLCLHPDWIDTGKQAVFLPMCLLPLPGFHLTPISHVREQHISLKGLFSF